MATVVSVSPYVERRVSERRRVAHTPALSARGLEGLRVSWGGIWAGVLVVMGALALLGALGVAVGISTVDPATANARSLAKIAAVWGAASLLVSLFLGGMVSTRIGMVYDRATGMLEGVLVWIVSALLMAAFAGSGLGLLPDVSFDLTTSRAAAWIGLAAMVLALAASVAGAMAGRRNAALRIGREKA